MTEENCYDRIQCIFFLFSKEKGLANRNCLFGWLLNQSETTVDEEVREN